MVDWINNRFDTNLSDRELNPIKDFTLLWNIFEKMIFNNSFSIPRMSEIIYESDMKIEDFNDIFIYFRNRYVTNREVNRRFYDLNFRNQKRMEFVRDTLIDENQNDKILSVGIIIYRLRNNLFHGLKDFRNLSGQVENFLNANRFLQLFIEKSSDELVN
jgi:hypothetical protein